MTDSETVVFADQDGDFLLSDGSFGNPGCDECGSEDAIVRVGTTYLCGAGWNERQQLEDEDE